MATCINTATDSVSRRSIFRTRRTSPIFPTRSCGRARPSTRRRFSSSRRSDQAAGATGLNPAQEPGRNEKGGPALAAGNSSVPFQFIEKGSLDFLLVLRAQLLSAGGEIERVDRHLAFGIDQSNFDVALLIGEAGCN